MSHRNRIDRRSFLRRAGATAVLGAMGSRRLLLAESPGTAGAAPPLPKQDFDFDEIYDRLGTDSSRWDGPVATFGDEIEVAMGIADMDFRAAPCITEALAERCQHENWGYLRRPASYIDAIVGGTSVGTDSKSTPRRSN